MTRVAVHALAIMLVLGAVAVLAPAPASSDRGIYEHVGREVLIRDCSDGHCFRPLVAVVLEHLPGPSLFKWKAYAVAANALAGVAVARFCLLLALPAPAALAGMWLAALGTGALYSLYDCYTSDPLMYLLGPVMAIALWTGRERRAGALAAAGVFAKEFAAAPLWIFALMACVQRRRSPAVRLLLTATTVTLVWLATQTALMALQNYRYGATTSADLLHGGFLATWLRSVGAAGAMVYLFTSFGALYVLLPIGLARCGRDLRLLAIASLPAAAAFVYVEQPERALWNFHFVVIPLAVVVLQMLPGWLLALFVAAASVVNLRYGAQLPIRSAARGALVVSVAIAIVAVVLALRRRFTHVEPAVDRARDDQPIRGWWWIAGMQVAALAALGAVLLDVRAHRLSEASFGVNQWGYRGPIASTRDSAVRIAVVGGGAAFGSSLSWTDTIPAQLQSALNQRRPPSTPGRRAARVDNLAEPAAGVRSYVPTLRRYHYLDPDVVCIYDGYDDPSSAGIRSRSLIFRSAGYLPTASPRFEAPRPSIWIDRDVHANDDPSCAAASSTYCAAMAETVRFVLGRGKAVVVATPPYVSPRHEQQQRSLAKILAQQFGADRRFLYVDLGKAIDLDDPEDSADAVYPTAAGARAIAETLVESVDRVLDTGSVALLERPSP
jgi:hypothetical protein